MAGFSIVTTVYNEYYLLREFIESILKNVDRDSYNEIIIVDDYSDNKGVLREYENYLSNTYDFIKVINFDEYRPIRWYQDHLVKERVVSDHGFDYQKFDSLEPNLGVYNAIWLGIQNVASDFCIVVDTDIIWLKKSQKILHKMSDIFGAFPKVMAMGQLVGVQGEVGIEVLKPFTVQLVNGRNNNFGGHVSPMAAAFRISGWKEHNLIPIPHPKNIKMGWGYELYFPDLFKKGYSTFQVPLFSKQYLFHVGRGTVRRNIRDCDDTVPKSYYGFCSDFKRTYAARFTINRISDYYSGAYKLKLSGNDFREYLKKKYKDTPFDQIREPINEDKLVKLDLCPFIMSQKESKEHKHITF